MAAESFPITKLEANQMGPIVHVGASVEAVQQTGTELRQLLTTFKDVGCCEAVQKLAIKAFTKACSVENATIRDCTFNVSAGEPKPAKSSEGTSPDGTSPGIAELLRRQTKPHSIPCGTAPDHGVGNY